MELYVSNIPLLIYEGTLGELETYNYFKLPYGDLIYKYSIGSVAESLCILECSYGSPHRLLFQAPASSCIF